MNLKWRWVDGGGGGNKREDRICKLHGVRELRIKSIF